MKKLILLLTASTVLSWIAIVYLLYNNTNKNPHFEVVTAERINIVNQDSTIVLAIANKQRIAAPRVAGKEYPVAMIERQHFAGMIFFNEQGDEMGGLIFNSGKTKDGRTYGSGHLSFDRFNDNQVVNLEYKENIHGTVKSGITFYDVPSDGSLTKQLDLLYDYKYKELNKEEKNKVINKLKDLKKNNGRGSERVFLGSHNEVSQLVLKDKQGNVKVKIYVDSLGNGRIQLLNKEGVATSKNY